MTDVSQKTFGYLIAFGLPGFLVLWGISFSSPAVATWLDKFGASTAPTVGGFLYVSLASLTLGMLLSAIRWATLEQILYRLTGLKRAIGTERELRKPDVLAAYQDVIERYYRFYQCYSHSLLAILIAFGFNTIWGMTEIPLSVDISVAVICVILFLIARVELRSFNYILQNILAGE